MRGTYQDNACSYEVVPARCVQASGGDLTASESLGCSSIVQYSESLSLCACPCPHAAISEQRALTYMLQPPRRTRSCRTSAQTVWPAFCPTLQATSGRATPSGCSAAPSRPPHEVGRLPQAMHAALQAVQQARTSRGRLLQARARALSPAQQESLRASSKSASCRPVSPLVGLH